MKRTPLKPGTKPLKRTPLTSSSTLSRTTKLKHRSDRTAKIYREQRIPLVKKILSERPDCEACLKLGNTFQRPSVDCHEILTRGRSGGVFGDAWLDPDNILAICRQCHTIITDHIGFTEDELQELGLLASS